jgi:GT2 family glycosyltransferase
MDKKVAIILVNYKDYAEKYLADCLAGLRKQNYPGEKKIFLVDNESTEESYSYLKQAAPEAEIIRNVKNDGFAKGNNDAMKLALERGYDYLVLFNLDTVIEPDCVSQLVLAAEGDGDIGAVQARLMLWPDKEKINSLGNITHFLGFGYAGGYGETYYKSAHSGAVKEICYPSGAAVLFKAEALKKVGLFDEEFWMYNEDQDLGWRIWLAGYKCVLAFDAVVYHKYEFSRSIKQYYFLDRNRIIAILKNYRLRTLILIAPAYLIMEFGLVFFSYKNGWFYEKIKVFNYFMNMANWQKIMAEREKVQNLRTVSDRKIIKMFSGRIWYQEIGDAKLKFANLIFGAYWKIVKAFIIW